MKMQSRYRIKVSSDMVLIDSSTNGIEITNEVKLLGGTVAFLKGYLFSRKKLRQLEAAIADKVGAAFLAFELAADVEHIAFRIEDEAASPHFQVAKKDPRLPG